MKAAPPPPPAEEPPPDEPPPGVATNPQPRDGATGVTVWKTAFNWDAAPRARSYVRYFGTSRDLSGDDRFRSADYQGTGWSFYWYESLAEETTYYWRVDAKNAAGTTRGDVWSFTTGRATGTLPGVASNPQPSDGAADVRGWKGYSCTSVGRLSLFWDAAPGGVGYFVYVGTSTDLASDNIRGSPFSVVAAAPPNNGISFNEDADFSLGTTYYWRVDAKNEAGITQGNVWSFTTKVWDGWTGPQCPGGG